MSGLVERVAETIRETMREGSSCARMEICQHGGCACCKDAARAALSVVRAALSDIPPEAIRAMSEAFYAGSRPMPDAARALADCMFKEDGNG